jgi:sialate O-acetylesterase
MALVTVSPIFGNHAVFQRGVPLPLWGKAPPYAPVGVSFLGKTYQTQSDAAGAWRLVLDSAACGGPFTLEVSVEGEDEILSINDVYVGDVWLCSGQSNMELPMERLRDDFAGEWEAPVNGLIRQFKVSQEWDFSGPRRDCSSGEWRAASAETLDEFSAAAWFFAQNLFEKYRMPVGLINAAWGGTPVEAWMSRDALAAFPRKIAQAEQCADAAFCAAEIKKTEDAINAWEAQISHAGTGLAEGWHTNTTDFSEWGEITLPGDFAAAGLAGFCGVLWLRKEFTVPAGFAAQTAKLWLGTIVDSDTVFVNGVEVGGTAYRYPPRKYTVPAGLLHEGSNVLLMRVVCNNGEGRVTKDKPFRLFAGDSRIELAGTWQFRVGMSAGAVRPEAFFLQRQPMGLCKEIIAPVLDVPCAGVIWYQGESNTGNPGEYAALFTALIQDWRRKKQRDDLPFLFVQLPLFGEESETNEFDSWAIIREAQCSALSLPATGMAAGLDLGEWNDLHPINKKDIGRRLALAADKVVFQNRNTSPGPLFQRVERRQGRLFLTFENCGAGLAARETPYVSIVAGGKLFRLPARIEGADGLSIDITAINNPEKVLYAWASNPRDRQLYNADGLPAIPFRACLAGACV